MNALRKGSHHPHVKSRQAILDRLRSMPVDAPELPTVDQSRLIRFDDPLAQFETSLAGVGGECHFIDDPRQASAILADIPVFAEAERIASVVPEAVRGNVDANSIDDPHDLASLDWVIARGEFGVAENGAIWIDGRTLPHRVMLFIAQYLAIMVSRSQLVDHMHQAYARLGSPDHSGPREPGFGIFVSGPSKTADIEQSLVIGAHGCRKLQVFLTP